MFKKVYNLIIFQIINQAGLLNLKVLTVLESKNVECDVRQNEISERQASEIAFIFTHSKFQVKFQITKLCMYVCMYFNDGFRLFYYTLGWQYLYNMKKPKV